MSRSLLVLSLLVALQARAAETKPDRVVRYRDDKVTLHAQDAPVADLLDELSRQSGAELRGEPPKDAKLTADFEAVPLQEALQRMLGENFTLRYADDGKLKTIDLKGGPEAPRKVPPPAMAGDVPIEPDTTPESWRRAYHSFDNQGRVPIEGRFAKVISADEANWDMVFNMAYGYLKDAKVRREAVRAGIRALESNPDLQATIADTVGKMDEDDLANFALHNCKHMCEELLKNIVRETHLPAFKSGALTLLRQLRKLPKPEPFTGA
jgi:hypothetical protein